MNRHFAKTVVGEFDAKDEMMIVIAQCKLEDFPLRQKSLWFIAVYFIHNLQSVKISR